VDGNQVGSRSIDKKAGKLQNYRSVCSSLGLRRSNVNFVGRPLNLEESPLVEKANSLIETEEETPELTGGGALSGPVPSGHHGAAGELQGDPGGAIRGSTTGTHPRPFKPIESGVYAGLSARVTGEHLTESLQSALSSASRAEAGLGSLNRSVRDASRALTALRHAHESLTEELRVMYRGLNEVMSEKAAIERYAALLTQERDAALDAAEDARREAKRDRDFLLREQDRFIQLLLEEHEAELQQLRRGIGQALDAAAPVRPVSVQHESSPSPRPAEGDEVAARRIAGSGRFQAPLISGMAGLARVEGRSETAPADEDEHGSQSPGPAVLDLDSLAA
jgi:hypothetical protein